MQKSNSFNKLALFWTIVVVFNAALCFGFGLMVSNDLMSILGMLTGIVCFIVFYTFVDYTLLANQKYLWHKVLRQSSIIRSFFQIFILLNFSIEFFCGILALSLLEVLFDNGLPLFFHSFLATLITGALLSIIVVLLSLMCFGIRKIVSKIDT